MVVRVGDYKQDSYYGQGMGETNILPLDDDPIALRHQIWLTTDEAYKAAGQALADKQAEMKRFSADPNPVDDFSKEPVVNELEPVVISARSMKPRGTKPSRTSPIFIASIPTFNR